MTPKRKPARQLDLLQNPMQEYPLFSGTPGIYRESEHQFVPRPVIPQAQLFGPAQWEELAEAKRQREALAREKKARAKSKTF